MDVAKTEDFLYSRYGAGAEAILKKDFEAGYEIVAAGYQAVSEERSWILYAGVYPWMTAENFMNFDAFLKSQRPKEVVLADNRTAEEILADTQRLFASV